MTTTDTNVENLIINTLTSQQYEGITPNANELYFVTDGVITSSDVTTALGYTPQNAATAVIHTASTAVGSVTQPIYVASDGTATATTYSLAKSVPADAVFTDSNVTQTLQTSIGADYPVIVAPAGQTATTTTTVGFIENMKFNPWGILTIGTVSSNTGIEGGQINLEAPAGNATKAGTILDNYDSTFRIFGIPSKDNTSITGVGTPLVIDPYAKTITGGYSFSGNATTATTASQAVAVIDNQSSNATKIWTGTQAQYDALVTNGTVDSNTLYNTDGANSSDLNVGRNIGEIIPSIIPLADAGLHLMDGSLILGSGIYSDFVSYIANLYNNTTKTYKSDAFTVVGSPTVTSDGIASGFSSGNIVSLPLLTAIQSSYEIELELNTGSSVNNIGVLQTNNLSNWAFVIDNYLRYPTLNNQTGLVNLNWQTDTNYKLKLVVNNNSLKLYINNVLKADVNDFSNKSISSFQFGVQSGNPSYLSTGSIDLKQFSISVDGKLQFSGAQVSGFCTEPEWQSSVQTYGVCGKFVYTETQTDTKLYYCWGYPHFTTSETPQVGDIVYEIINGNKSVYGTIINAGNDGITVNTGESTSILNRSSSLDIFATAKTVRLPKITGFIEGTATIADLGNLIEAGLPDHTHAYNDNVYGWEPIAHGDDQYRNYAYTTTLINTGLASATNSIYGNSNTVQPQAIKVLYYIVIATTVKTEIEVGLDEVATDLNGKMDKDGSNATCSVCVESYVNGTSWYRVYSDGWCEQGGEISNLVTSTTTTVYFLKNFVDTNYYINVSDAIVGSTWAGAEANDMFLAFRTGGFDFIQAYGRTCSFRWQASGYIS